MKQWLQDAAMAMVDGVMAVTPRAVPNRDALRNCKIISHRGEHDNIKVIENTLSAFGNARENGVWGIECDIRWTADLVPVIHHDPTGMRLFGQAATIAELTFAQLRSQLPLVPSLAEVIEEYGSNTHLMLEIKEPLLIDPPRQKSILREQLGRLTAGRDYHLLALDPALLTTVDFVSRQHCCLVAELNVARLSANCLTMGWGGLTGHYLLLNDAMRLRHRQAGQLTGTGFIRSKNCLFRELNRGVEWIFSNDAVALQKIRDGLL